MLHDGEQQEAAKRDLTPIITRTSCCGNALGTERKFWHAPKDLRAWIFIKMLQLASEQDLKRTQIHMHEHARKSTCLRAQKAAASLGCP
jgi:hypothetical protein